MTSMTLPMIPDNIIENIILRLPPKGVARFKCASKPWRRLLSDSSFATKYRIRNLSLRCFFSNFTYDIHRYVFADDFSRNHKHIRFDEAVPNRAVAPVASAGNLMVYYESTMEEPPKSTFFLSNPFTRDRVDLPPPPPATNCPTASIYKRFIVYGIAYDCLFSDPKIFAFCELTEAADSTNGLLMNKYCSLKRRWVSKIFPNLVDLGDNFVLNGRGVFLNSHLHWLVQEPSSWILAYNPSDEATGLSLIKTPVSDERDYLDDQTGICKCTTNQTDQEYFCPCRYLGECGGSLVYCRVTGDSEFSMWILEDYDKSRWSPRRKFAIDDPEVPLCTFGISSLYRGGVIGSTLTKEGDVLVYLTIARTVFSYNCSSGKLKKDCNVMETCYGGGPYRFSPLVPYEELPNFSLPFPFDGIETDGTISNSSHAAGSHAHYGVISLMSKFDLDIRRRIGGGPYLGRVWLDSSAVYSNFVRLEASLHGGRFAGKPSVPLPTIILRGPFEIEPE